eukprot:GABV01008675.1.p1 GENE.GABV01008675.1~~GABV01008675.1.p1  ORF type:complete len:172 (-),score=60.80 GABV01008675.1:425-940(-)
MISGISTSITSEVDWTSWSAKRPPTFGWPLLGSVAVNSRVVFRQFSPKDTFAVGAFALVPPDTPDSDDEEEEISFDHHEDPEDLEEDEEEHESKGKRSAAGLRGFQFAWNRDWSPWTHTSLTTSLGPRQAASLTVTRHLNHLTTGAFTTEWNLTRPLHTFPFFSYPHSVVH